MKVKFNNRDLFHLVSNGDRIKSSYSFIYHEFKDVSDNLKMPVPFNRSCKLSIRESFFSTGKRNLSRDDVCKTYLVELSWYKEKQYTIFGTDASVGVSATGIGVFNVSCNQKCYFAIKRRTSSSFGELVVILKALEIAVEDRLSKIVIFSDSPDNAYAAKIHNLIQNSCLEAVCLVWTPSHMGIACNEMADTMAKLDVDVGAPLDLPITVTEALRSIKDILRATWDSRYKILSQSKGRFFASFNPNIMCKLWFKGLCINAKKIKIINCLMAGHVYDKTYLKKKGASYDDCCDLCNSEQTAHHLIFECRKYIDLRRNFVVFKKFYNMRDIFISKKTEYYIQIAEFVCKANLSF